MKIELIDHMGDDLRVANVARVSFNKWKEDMDHTDARLIKFLALHEHETPFRHCQITLRCEAPIYIARQLGKHQVGFSWNEVSRRYVDEGIEFYTPEGWRKRPEDGIKQGSSDELVTHLYDEVPIEEVISEHHQYCLSLYKHMLSSGVAPELARSELPQSMMTTWTWTGSLAGFFHMYRLRIEGHAQKEAQIFAKLLEDAIEPLFPVCWKALKKDEM